MRECQQRCSASNGKKAPAPQPSIFKVLNKNAPAYDNVTTGHTCEEYTFPLWSRIGIEANAKLKQMPALHLFKLFKDHWTKTSAPFLQPTSWQKILRIPIQFNRCLVYFYVVDGTLWVPNDPPNLSTSITSWWNFSLLAWPRYNEDLSNPGPVKPLYNWASPIPTT